MMCVAVAVMVTVRCEWRNGTHAVGVWQRTRSAAVASAWSFSSAELDRDFSSFYSASLACQFRYL